MMYLHRACFLLILLISLVELAGCGGGSPGGNAPRGSINKPPANLQYPGNNVSYAIGATVNYKPTIDNTVFSCSSSPKLPAGLNIDNNTCAITGSPTIINSPNTKYVITASNDAGVTSTTLQITIDGTIGGTGTVTGYSSGSGLILHNDINNDSVTLQPGQTSFIFPTALKGGDAYTVSVSAQPSNPAQICSVSQYQGTMKVGGGNISTIAVNCYMARTIGVSVSGLAGTGLTLLDNSTDLISVSGNGSFTFPTLLPDEPGSTYAVTVRQSPNSPTQTCDVINGAGPVGSTDVTVAVVCTTKWYSKGGSKFVNTAGTYPASAPNAGTPGGRYASANWTDSSGQQLWMFGGWGCDSTSPCTEGTTSTVGDLNDLWMYDLSTQKWTWEGGSTTKDAPLNYPAKVNDPGTPGARDTPMSWRVGNTLWMFGGWHEKDANGVTGYLNDLWKYVPGSGWFWEGGSTVNDPGIYTATATAAVHPGARYGAATWVDSNGDLWLFGGYGCDSGSTCTSTSVSELNDLWMYDPLANAGAGSWTWEGGSSTKDAAGIYTASPGSAVFPGARNGAVTWTDSKGLWLFGGYGCDSTSTCATTSVGYLNDFWLYVPGTGWSWEGGSQTAGDVGSLPSSFGETGYPSARFYGSTWVDNRGRFWMLGGYGDYSQAPATTTPAIDDLGDLWMFDPNPATGSPTWTWEGGEVTSQDIPVYPKSCCTQGTPGGRYDSPVWIDTYGQLWLFGGSGWNYDSSVTTLKPGYLNDLWMLQL